MKTKRTTAMNLSIRKRVTEAVAEPASRLMALCLTAIVLAITALLVAVSRGR